MQFWRKLVSFSLLMVVVALPLVAMATCAPESAKPMHCCKKCPMMAKMQGKMKHSGQSNKGTTPDKGKPCCDIKSSQPAPVAEYQSVAPVVIAEPVASVAAVAELPHTASTPVAEAALPPPLNSQARLCTFQN